MSRSVVVVIHAASGVGGLLVGLYVLSPPHPGDGRLWARRTYSLCIAILLVSLALLLAIDWSGLEATARVAFGALAGLAVLMAYKVVRAGREASARGEHWQERYIDHMYFTYVALWEGFVILPALNLPLPQLLVPAVAIALVVIGHGLIGRYKARVLPG